MNKIITGIKSYFNFSERSATFKKEIIGGLSTFLAMAYILAVNPGMLSAAHMDPKDQLLDNHYAGVFFLGTAIASFVATFAMGVFAKVPVALAPGMGVNAFFTYTVASPVLGLTLPQALIATLASGVLYAIVAVTPLRSLIAKMLPKNMKLAIGAMIGLFLAYIGLCDSGIVVSGATQYTHFVDPNLTPATGLFDPKNQVTQSIGGMDVQIKGIATVTKLGNFADPFVIIALVTIALVFVLHFLKVKGAAIIAMFAAIIMVAIAYGAGVHDAGSAFTLKKYEDFGKFGELSSKMWNSFGSAFTNGKFYIAVFVFLYVDFFDTTGTLFSVGEQAGLNKGEDKGEKWMKKANMVDAGGTIFGSIMLTSTVTSYIESSVGVSQGAKTGFSAAVTGLMFAIAIALWPIMSPILPISHFQNGVVNQVGTVMPVTGPILVLVGALMVSQLKHFEWDKTIEIPALFVTLVFGMLSYSISTGIAAGVLVHFFIHGSALLIELGKVKLGKSDGKSLEELKKVVINPVLLVMVALAIAYFGTMPLYAY